MAEARGRARPPPAGEGGDAADNANDANMQAPEAVTVTALLQQLTAVLEGARPQPPADASAAAAPAPLPGGPAGGGQAAAPAGAAEAPGGQPRQESGGTPSATVAGNASGAANAFSAALAVLAERQKEGNFRPY